MRKFLQKIFIYLAVIFPASCFSVELISYEIPNSSVGSYMFKAIPLVSMIDSVGEIAAKDGYRLTLKLKKAVNHKNIEVFANKYPWPNILEDIAYRNNLILKLDKRNKHVYITD